MSISPADMVLFAAVVREGSFTTAARVLGITKQTASQRISSLESQLGLRLIERTTRRLRVTHAGGVYYERCNAIAADIEAANREVRDLQLEPSGVLRVSSPVLYGRRYLAPVITHYLARYERARVELVLADRRVDLVAEGIDLAIRIGKLDDSSLAAKKLGEGHVYYVASPSFLGAHGVPEPERLREARAVGLRPVETWTVGDTSAKVEPVLVVNDLEIACEAAVAGVGVARLPAIVCREAVRARRLCVLFPSFVPIRRPVHAVFPSRALVPAKVRVFIDALAALTEPMLPLDITKRTSRGGQL